MKPTHWLFRANRWLEEAGYLRFRKDAAAPTENKPLAYAPELEDALVEEQPPFAEIDFGETRAYCFGYGGQIYLGEVTGAEEDRGLADELAEALGEIAHPESGEPAFDVRRKEELYRGFYLDRAPELVLLPRDERIHVDSTRQRWAETFQRHEHLFARGAAHFSGQHAVTGILAAAGPGIGRAPVPPGSEITQVPATILALHGLGAELDAPAIEEILDAGARGPSRRVEGVSQTPVEPSGYSPEEEELIVKRLRDLGYE
jgi:predicted AlkP superfamily phosphohydrolase/phosphomutase